MIEQQRHSRPPEAQGSAQCSTAALVASIGSTVILLSLCWFLGWGSWLFVGAATVIAMAGLVFQWGALASIRRPDGEAAPGCDSENDPGECQQRFEVNPSPAV